MHNSKKKKKEDSFDSEGGVVCISTLERSGCSKAKKDHPRKEKKVSNISIWSRVQVDPFFSHLGGKERRYLKFKSPLQKEKEAYARETGRKKKGEKRTVSCRIKERLAFFI